ncbi:MAG: ABC transporter permease [Steroidobacteraceae bacterium]
MFRHYLATALRSMVRHRLYSLINLVGLSVGLACAILIALYARYELSYDKWIPDTANLYRLEVTAHIPGRPTLVTNRAPFPALSLMGSRIRGVSAATHVVPELMTVHIGKRAFLQKVTVVDPDFFSVIRLPLARGDPDRVLSQPETIVLSQSMARKYFGESDPIGKTLTVTHQNSGCRPGNPACADATYALTVSGVLRDLPPSTQLVADLIMPNTSRADEMSRQQKEASWNDISPYGYVRLVPGTQPAAVLAEFGPLLDRAFDAAKMWGVNRRASQLANFHLTPFTAVHLTTDRYGGMTPAGSRITVYGLLVISVLIVLIACFNFMNLATARATLRAREITVRKVGGAKRRQLIIQFLSEAVLMASISLAIALSLVELLLRAFDRFSGAPITFSYFADWRLLLAFVAGAAAVGVLGGTYPALVLSAFRPAAAFKTHGVVQGGSGLLRSALVVAQFAVSIGLGVTALVVLAQLKFARNVDLGFARQGVVVIGGIAQVAEGTRGALARTMQANPQIEGIAYSSEVPFLPYHPGGADIRLPGQRQVLRGLRIDMSPEFPHLYGMQLLAGRMLSADRGQDVSTSDKVGNVLINATAAHRLGLKPTEAVGRTIEVEAPRSTARIIGVLSDARFHGINELAQPYVYTYEALDSPAMQFLSVRLRGDRTADTLAYIDRTWRSLEPGAVIARWFLSDSFDGTLQGVRRQGVLVALSVGIAIFIACLGLLGLAVFTTERRTKEVGMRKIAGARVADIVRLLLWRISMPVLIANVVAWPIAYYYLRRWLDGYAYRTDLSASYFLIASAGALLIAWATVFAHTLQLARSSPVHALRYE